jgi:hypothetical protein
VNRRHIAIALVVVFAFVAAAAVAPPASAAAPCWKRLVNDWYDGRIDKTYPISCYQDAIRNLPRDVDEYSSAREDIQRALAQEIRRQNEPPDEEPPTQTTGGGGVAPPNDSGPGPTGEESKAEPTPEQSGAIAETLKSFRPEDAESVPLPLIVLAGLAGLLLAGAGASYLARRYQSRRDGLLDGPPAD